MCEFVVKQSGASTQCAMCFCASRRFLFTSMKGRGIVLLFQAEAFQKHSQRSDCAMENWCASIIPGGDVESSTLERTGRLRMGTANGRHKAFEKSCKGTDGYYWYLGFLSNDCCRHAFSLLPCYIYKGRPSRCVCLGVISFRTL